MRDKLQAAGKKQAHSLFTSGLDFLCGIVHKFPQIVYKLPQLIWNVAAKILTATKKKESHQSHSEISALRSYCNTN